FPFAARRISPASEIAPVPELSVNPLAWVVVNADRTSALRAQLVIGRLNLRLAFGQSISTLKLHPRDVRAHFKYIQHPAIIERLVVNADVVAFVQIHSDAHPLQRRESLRSPRRPRLAVTTRRDPEDSFDVAHALGFASVKLGGAIFPAGVLQIDGDGRLSAVRVRMITDLVFLERRDHVLAAAPFERPSLLSHDFERRANA